jgi:hypothetical protein
MSMKQEHQIIRSSEQIIMAVTTSFANQPEDPEDAAAEAQAAEAREQGTDLIREHLEHHLNQNPGSSYVVSLLSCRSMLFQLLTDMPCTSAFDIVPVAHSLLFDRLGLPLSILRMPQLRSILAL